MGTIEDLEKHLSGLEQEIKDIEAKMKAAKDELVKLCPVAIGDTVAINDHSYTGQKMIVHKINYFGSSLLRGDAKYRCLGYVLKKDGTPGKNIGETYV